MIVDVRGTAVRVVRKPIKHLHLGVYPPDGRVRVAAPPHVDDDAVRLAVVMRLGWIRRRQAEFERQARQSRREMVTGESHYVDGRRYRLNVVERDGPREVRLTGNSTLTLHVRPGDGRDARDAVLQRWYRRRLRDRLPALLAKWEPRVGVAAAEVRIRRMKTRWGSCNPHARRIWLNPELARKPPACLEYVLAHELVHLIERRHTDRFRALMDRFLPRWRQRRDELNRAPLAHEEWTYRRSAESPPNEVAASTDGAAHGAGTSGGPAGPFSRPRAVERTGTGDPRTSSSAARGGTRVPRARRAPADAECAGGRRTPA